MICDMCAFGADVMTDYRDDAEQGIAAGEDSGRVHRWLLKRARRALALHCRGRSVGCTCQHRIREIEEAARWPGT